MKLIGLLGATKQREDAARTPAPPSLLTRAAADQQLSRERTLRSSCLCNARGVKQPSRASRLFSPDAVSNKKHRAAKVLTKQKEIK